MVDCVQIDRQWKRQEDIARVDGEDDWFEQLLRDEQEFKEHLDRIFTYVPPNHIIHIVMENNCCEEVSVDINTRSDNKESLLL